MFNLRSYATAAVLVGGLVLAGCAPKTNVSATGNVPAQYQHLLLTVQEVWFNTDATATPDGRAYFVSLQTCRPLVGFGAQVTQRVCAVSVTVARCPLTDGWPVTVAPATTASDGAATTTMRWPSAFL